MRLNKELKEELDNAIDTSDTILKWKPDPGGYFTVRPIPSRKRVFIRHYDSDDTLKHTFSGINASQMMQSIIERRLISRLDHAAYLGREIEKAIIALKNRLNYVQDEELQLEDKERS